jgi:hypothetical protein
MSRDFETAASPTDSPSLEQRARRRVALKTGFYTHALVFVLVNAGLFLLAALGGWGGGSDQGWGPAHRPGLAFPLWGWGLGLTIHGIVVWLKLQGEGLRRRMLEREIETLKRRDDGQR